ADQLFKRHLDGRWEDLFTRPENHSYRDAGEGRSAAAIDRRGSGRYGFFVAGADSPPQVVELGPDGFVTDLAPSLGLNFSAGVRGLLAAPLLGTHTDLFGTSRAGPNLLLRNRGDGSFEECSHRLKLA